MTDAEIALARPAESSTLAKPMRVAFPSGSQTSQSVARIPPSLSSNNAIRARAEQIAREGAVAEYCRTYGEVEWDYARLLVSHMACSVAVHLSVDP